MRPALLLLLLSLWAWPASASDVTVSDVRLLSPRGGGEIRLSFVVAWEHSWRNERNHDAVWLFAKAGGSGDRQHVRFAEGGHRIVGDQQGVIEIDPEGTGFFVLPQRAHRGPVEWFVDLAIHPESAESAADGVDVFAVEMVFVPEGPFEVGDPDPTSAGFGALFRADQNGGFDGPFPIASEAAIDVGPGSLSYERAQYQGDGLGPIPESFPKGTRAFYIMKYELTQGQYADFLNAIGAESTFDRAGFLGRGYYSGRGSIRLEGDVFVADHPDRPMNFMTWDDGLAWTDWAGLRPVTELEFTKAARGPESPVAGGFPWGTADKAFLKRDVTDDGNLAGPDEALLSDETRGRYGASHFWVMDLAGSVWERVISVGSPDGRSFSGSHGDGNLDGGRADNSDWPHTWAGRGGHGYRGGGFYDPGRPEHQFNPHSPVAYRPFGAWAGPSPHRAYGYRAGRTASR